MTDKNPQPQKGEEDKVEESTKIEPVEEVKEEKKFTVMDTETTDVMNPHKYAQVKALANDFFRSGALPQGYDNQFKVIVAIQAGQEMGLSPLESISAFYFVNGQWSLWGKNVLKQARKHGWAIEYSDESMDSCTATITKGDEKHTETFTFQEAEKSGYTKGRDGRLKFGWSEGMNRKLKLRYGAISVLIKTYIPEVLGSAAGIAEIDQDAVTITQPNAAITTDPANDDKPATEDQLGTIRNLLNAKADKIEKEIEEPKTFNEAVETINYLVGLK
jgi:hypothetical protein